MGRVIGVLALMIIAASAAGAWAQGPGGGATASPRIPSRGGAIVLKVTDYERARREVLEAARAQGAELLQSRTEVNFQGKQHGWMRFRVGAERLPALLPAVRGVGRLYAENLTTADHTSEYEELERRIQRLREHQPRLAGLLQSSRRLRGSDILYVQERLFRAGVDEGSLMQRRADLERGARAATLVIELFEPEPRRALDLGNYYAGSVLRARGMLYRCVARTLTAGAYVLVFAPFWVPGLLLALLLARWLLRRARGMAVRLAASFGWLVATVRTLRQPAR
jgi:hypothetical protein